MQQQLVITPSELAQMLGKNRVTIYRWESAGVLPPRIHFTNTSTGWLRSTIEDWLKEKAMQNAA